VPSYKSPGWIATARTVRDLVGNRFAETLGVSTWLSAIREDGLLAIARHGVVFARGAQYESLIGAFNTPDEVVGFLRTHPPVAYRRT